MEEAEVNSEQEEVTPHEAESEPQEEQVEQQDQGPKQSWQDRNWAAMRQKMSEMEQTLREKDELIARAVMSQQKQEPEDPDPDWDDYANYGGVKKLATKAVKPIEEKLQNLEKELAASRQRELMNNLRSQYSDFDQIVNPETIAIFEQKEPELAQSIAEIKDPYKMGISSYKYIKALNIQDELPGKKRQKETAKMLDKNSKTVQSPQAYDKRPMAQAFHLSEQEKSNLYSEMMSYAALAPSAKPMG